MLVEQFWFSSSYVLSFYCFVVIAWYIEETYFHLCHLLLICMLYTVIVLLVIDPLIVHFLASVLFCNYLSTFSVFCLYSVIIDSRCVYLLHQNVILHHFAITCWSVLCCIFSYF